MERELNIELNIDRESARLIMVRACGFTRDGGTPTLTGDCATYGDLEAEAQRLKNEIDAALERARVHFDVKEAEETHARKVVGPGGAANKPHLFTDLKTRDVMTRDVRTVNRNDTLSLAEELMRLGGFRHVVVVDDRGTVAGVVSSRDIFYGALAWSLGLGRAAHEKSLAAYPVKQVMASDVTTVKPDTELREAARLMAEKKIGCVPVVEAGQLVGILTEGDILAILTEPPS